MEEIKLSIIIPIYNSQNFLRTCLETVAKCPFAQVECILINDGSKDDSLIICEEFKAKDERFRILDKKNEGVSAARNSGMTMAQGTYIMFLDADDYLDISKWNDIFSILDKGFDFAAFSYFTVSEDDNISEELFPATPSLPEDVFLLKKLLVGSSCLNTCWGKLFRRQIITDNALQFPINLKTGEDAVFVIDYIQYIKNYLLENQSILYYRQHTGSAMHSMNIEGKLKDLEVLYQKRIDIIQKDGNKELEEVAYRQFFSVITNLYLEAAKQGTIKETVKVYQNAGRKSIVQEIIKLTPYQQLAPVYKRLEYYCIKKKYYQCLTIYFKCKSRFG